MCVRDDGLTNLLSLLSAKFGTELGYTSLGNWTNVDLIFSPVTLVTCGSPKADVVIASHADAPVNLVVVWHMV